MHDSHPIRVILSQLRLHSAKPKASPLNTNIKQMTHLSFVHVARTLSYILCCARLHVSHLNQVGIQQPFSPVTLSLHIPLHSAPEVTTTCAYMESRFYQALMHLCTQARSLVLQDCAPTCTLASMHIAEPHQHSRSGRCGRFSFTALICCRISGTACMLQRMKAPSSAL